MNATIIHSPSARLTRCSIALMGLISLAVSLRAQTDNFDSGTDAGWSKITSANFPAEAYGAIAGYARFRRTVTIQDSTPAAGMKTISVQVFFTPQYQTRRGSEEAVQVSTLIAQRP